MAPNASLSRTTADEVGATTERGKGCVLSSSSGDGSVGETAYSSWSVPSTDVCRGAVGAVNV